MTKKINLSVGFIIAMALVFGVPTFAKADTLYRQLEVGSTGSDVGSLQTFLAQDISLYPQGLVTSYFGVYTKAAVSKFQTRNDIPAVGRVGPITLPIINAQMANGINGTDVYAPTLSNVNISAKDNTATVSWSTSEATRGVVYYSNTPLTVYESLHSVNVNGSVASTDSALRFSQSILISGLQRNTTYHYLIQSTDAANNVSVTMPSTFRTN